MKIMFAFAMLNAVSMILNLGAYGSGDHDLGNLAVGLGNGFMFVALLVICAIERLRA